MFSALRKVFGRDKPNVPMRQPRTHDNTLAYMAEIGVDPKDIRRYDNLCKEFETIKQTAPGGYMNMTKKTIDPVVDSTGKEIQLHDVLKDLDTGEMALVVKGTNVTGVRGLSVDNEIAGISDWLDVYPDGVWTIVGNAATVTDETRDELTKEERLQAALTHMTEKERQALSEAVSVLYLEDNSDYLNGLWGVVRAILGDSVEEDGYELKDILYLLDPELAKGE